MKKNGLKLLGGLIMLTILIMIGSILIFNYNNRFKYSQEYIPGKNNIKGSVDVEFFLNKGNEFAIGANRYGYAVFKQPSTAFKKLKKDYQKGLNLIKTEFDLDDLNQDNYKVYGMYGWQVTTGSQEEKEEARFVTLFMDIYENSFSD